MSWSRYVEALLKKNMTNGGFEELPIRGVYLRRLERHEDTRGWLFETLRRDWLLPEEQTPFAPVMSYLSWTRPDAVRGPHEHGEQIDYFAFTGPSNFRVVLWDNRVQSETKGRCLEYVLGEDRPAALIVPPGVVHAYKNVGAVDGLVLNLPNRLYAGENRCEPVDEVRHENDSSSPFRMEEK